jgi:hypothetical protein
MLGMILFLIIAIIIGTILYCAKNSGLRKLKEAGATSPIKAVKSETVGISWLEKNCMLFSDIVESTNDGRYYIIDERNQKLNL